MRALKQGLVDDDKHRFLYIEEHLKSAPRNKTGPVLPAEARMDLNSHYEKKFKQTNFSSRQGLGLTLLTDLRSAASFILLKKTLCEHFG
jgi:hypothetical protein